MLNQCAQGCVKDSAFRVWVVVSLILGDFSNQNLQEQNQRNNLNSTVCLTADT